MQIYSKKPSNKMQPQKNTIQFLLDYSKSLKIMKTKSTRFIEFNLN